VNLGLSKTALQGHRKKGRPLQGGPCFLHINDDPCRGYADCL
jgi:hypothetical protein